MKTVFAIVPVVAITAAVLGFASLRKPEPPTGFVYKTSLGNTVAKERRSIDGLYASANWKEAEKSYSEFVEEHKDSSNPEVQDEVAIARIHVGYIQGKSKDWRSARETFLEAGEEYKGTGVKDLSYGSLADQALYQAAVCLAAGGKKSEAISEFESFIKNRPNSPMVHACWKRLKKLNGGESKPEWDALLQTAVTKSEKQSRLEAAMCGPKVLEAILNYVPGEGLGNMGDSLAKQEIPTEAPKTYQSYAKLAQTDSRGTTLQQMITAFKELGFESRAMELNAADFANLKAPAAWLKTDHYVAILESAYNKFLVYDPMTGSREWMPAPKTTDKDFRATVLILRKAN